MFIAKSQFCYRNSENGDIEDMSLEAIFSEDESDEDEGDVDVDDSGSDGYLSEVLKPIMCVKFLLMCFISWGLNVDVIVLMTRTQIVCP